VYVDVEIAGVVPDVREVPVTSLIVNLANELVPKGPVAPVVPSPEGPVAPV
jgi:hypothetical protein